MCDKCKEVQEVEILEEYEGNAIKGILVAILLEMGVVGIIFLVGFLISLI
jgi:hypothetical protein